MKSMFKLFGIIALVAVIGFVAACSNGSTGGGGRDPGVQRPIAPLKETYVSYDAGGNKYELVITEPTIGRALDPNLIYNYKLTITLVNGNVEISTGTAKIKIDTETSTIESITLTHSESQVVVTVTVSSNDGSNTGAITSFSVNIPIDNKPVPLPKPAGLYILNSDGTGYIIVQGAVENGVAVIPEKLPDGKPVTAIGYAAFANNKDLRSVTIPASIISIDGWGNFEGCTNLTTVTFAPGSQLKTIGGGAFEGCTSLKNITIPAGVTSIGHWAFKNCSFTSITIPANVTAIYEGAFDLCTSLTTVTFAAGSRLKTIGAAFVGCTSLSTITIPASVTTIDSAYADWDGAKDELGAFIDCTNLTTVIFAPNSQLETIGNNAFRSCTNLTSITIPAGVTSIGYGTFAGWTPSQTINVQGHANQQSADAAWGTEWRWACNATINYNG